MSPLEIAFQFIFDTILYQFPSLQTTRKYGPPMAIVFFSVILTAHIPNRYYYLPSSITYLIDQVHGIQYPEISEEVFHSPEVFKRDYLEMERKFKVFVYPTEEMDATCYETGGSYASEVYFYKNLKESQFLTNDPKKAHLFFVLIPCHKPRQDQGISDSDMLNTTQDYIQHLIVKYPYWNATLGADHFYMACHDIDVTTAATSSHLMKNSIRLVCSSSYDDEYVPHRDVSLPPALPAVRENVGNRKLLRIHHTKDQLVQTCPWEDDGHDSQGNTSISSIWCICPNNDRVHGIGLADAVHHGCIPVISAEHYDLPLNDVLDWKRFSFDVDPDEVLLHIHYYGSDDYKYLKYMAKVNNNIMKVKKHFQWNSPQARLDAFHMVMYQLWKRRHVIKYSSMHWEPLHMYKLRRGSGSSEL